MGKTCSPISLRQLRQKAVLRPRRCTACNHTLRPVETQLCADCRAFARSPAHPLGSTGEALTSRRISQVRFLQSYRHGARPDVD